MTTPLVASRATTIGRPAGMLQVRVNSHRLTTRRPVRVGRFLLAARSQANLKTAAVAASSGT